jgi:hypothetical protein
VEMRSLSGLGGLPMHANLPVGQKSGHVMCVRNEPAAVKYGVGLLETNSALI